MRASQLPLTGSLQPWFGPTQDGRNDVISVVCRDGSVRWVAVSVVIAGAWDYFREDPDDARACADSRKAVLP